MPLVDFILHIDVHLVDMVNQYGVWIYAILFLIILCETGLVVTPFLPGDSLLFAVGALGALSPDQLNPVTTGLIVIVAAFLGDNSNYWAGRIVGPKVFKQNSRIFKHSYLVRTQHFYDKYGHKAVIMARFVPIVRTFAPFVAGIGRMPYLRFVGYSTLGSVLWAVICIGAGFFLGNIPIVKQNFSLVILVIIAISVLPIVITVIKESRANKKNAG
jgi:membrane-associated protein